MNTLLVSAPPNFYFVNELLAIDDIVNMESLNQSQYKIEFKDFDDNLSPTKPFFPKGTVKIKNNSLRGNNRFMQMAVVNVDNGGVAINNEYACQNGESFTL